MDKTTANPTDNTQLIQKLRSEYISELERDMRIANDKLMDHDTATDHQ